MKKKMILGMFLFASFSVFAEMEVERGYENFEFSTSYSHLQSREKILSPYKEIHDFISLQNDFLYKQGTTLDWEKENIWRTYAIGGTGKKYKNTGGGILFYHTYDEGSYIGFQMEGREVKFTTYTEALKGIRGSIRFFFDKQQENRTRLFITPYYIFDNVKKIQNKSIGIYAKQEIALDLSKYSLPEEGIKTYIEVDTHRNSVKKEKEVKDKHRNKNDSIRAGIGISYEEIFDVGEFEITPKMILGYEREFLEKRKYRSIEIQEQDIDNAKISVGVDIRYKNVNLMIENMFLKSINTRNHENRVQAILTYKF
ncbi:hypothetical protein HMPREF1049_0141 [Fusobacterium necrophorum subsp. funduliforme ATCC 51357]|uniref:hypothetical protein n=1 Tax=Fusobacterium necrophorum TaxID=859 RepID=UPI00025E5C32|nr:hypothetical protein [Fusobacterium necrophorum]EIJ72054.1 hypothetical protein HMPREF1049_0141 [Fusobacterium necrophorum subsp. funduliforme ATCC 51357]KAB0553506.1 hypothetical protein F7P76_04095 [Fusobacterium necrophorum subsp. funduliforme]